MASILKVSKLQYWIGRKWSEGCFSSGIKAIVEVGEKFLFKEIIDKEDLALEFFKLNLQKEVDDSKSHLRANNFKIIHQIKSTATFWIKNVIKFPLLSKLALVLLNVKSSRMAN